MNMPQVRGMYVNLISSDWHFVSPLLSFSTILRLTLCWASRVTIAHMLLTMSLGFVGATYHSSAINTLPVVTFVLAVISKREKIRFRSVHGQTKIWGVAISTLGAMVMLFWRGPAALKSSSLSSSPSNTSTGGLMVTGRSSRSLMVSSSGKIWGWMSLLFL